MDWISTTTGCFAVSNAIAKIASDLHRFVRDVRESRADLAPLSAELHALDGVLDLLKDDAASVNFPADLALQTPAVVAGSGAVVADLDAIFSDGGGSGDNDDDPLPSSSVSPQEKRARWLALRPHIEESRAVLEVYRLALGLALDLVALTQNTHTTDSSTADTPNVLNAKAKDMARLQAEMSHLRTRVRSDLNDGDAAFILLNYLNVLQRHATSAEEEAKRTPEPEQKPEPEPEPERQREDSTILNHALADLDLRNHNSVDLHLDPPSLQFRDEAVASPVGKAPDSAVEILDDEAADKGQSSNSLPIPRTLGVDAPKAGSSVYSSRQPSPVRQSRPSSPSMPPPPTPPPRDTARGPALLPPNEIDNLMDELRDELPSRPPTPPPKAVARGSSAMSFRPGEVDYLSGANSSRYLAAAPTQLSHSVSNGNFAGTTTTTSSTTAYPPSTSNNRFGRFLRHIRSTSATTTAEMNKRPSTATDAGAGAGRTGLTGAVDLSSLSVAPTPLTNIVSSNSNSSSGQSGSSSGGGNGNGNGTGIERRSSRRFSASFRAPWAVTTVIEGGGAAAATSPAKKDRKRGAALDDEPDAVFGVSLRKSIHMAGASARTHHSGGHGASRREFPLCVFRCYTFIRSDGGLETPDLFGGGVPGVDVDSFDVVNFDRVRALRDRFSTGPLYGVDLDDASMAAEYSRHDAAAVILQYLEALPRPLVSDSVVRRWVTLSRQATITGSYSKRLDQCIDFWEEALGGVRGPARSLLKLLLNLWGDIADAADRNDMTAERLAGRVLQPLMQLDGGQYHTDYMLSLAFIIRKRSEYALLLRGGGRKSNAAFET